MKIGILLPTWCDSAYAAPTRGTTVLDRARLAEDMGLSSVWVIDHFCYQPYLDYQAMDMEPPAALKGSRVVLGRASLSAPAWRLRQRS